MRTNELQYKRAKSCLISTLTFVPMARIHSRAFAQCRLSCPWACLCSKCSIVTVVTILLPRPGYCDCVRKERTEDAHLKPGMAQNVQLWLHPSPTLK